MSREPTGYISKDGDKYRLQMTRTFNAPIEDVWAAVTEAERLERWIGTFNGNPADGHVAFQMTAEEGAPAQDMRISECVPPSRLAVVADVGEQQWHLEIDLTENDGVTTLVFSQPGVSAAEADSVGPGWEFYLDRLVAAETNGDVDAIKFEQDYYPAMQQHYRSQL